MSAGRQRRKARCACVQTLTDPRDQSPTGLVMRGRPPASLTGLHGLPAEPWTKPARTGAHVRRAAGFVAWSQVEAGHMCPISMTYAAVPALQSSPDLLAIWAPLLAWPAGEPRWRAGRDSTGGRARRH